ncbi:hypothetical protein QQS21_010911 [Conoideocrella luteorostrata]|uniref:Biotin-protein ligase N-terminal domain-containing protein n=1 Tax=Conoideocrella luteorostrata TaxID=1105319 RepID=A0AAJ0FWE0_9HYPO|nr:hypothetical protein QQS21_010911 [Conoideocrella luteorostrata]
MYTSTLLTAITLALSASTATAADAQPRALVYRGPQACKGCAEAVGKLLEGSAQKFAVTYVGPKEDNQISADLLSQAAVYAQPGGPDLNSAYRELKEHSSEIRTFVQNGGRYLGFCLGAFLAGDTPGFGLLPDGMNAVAERKSDGAQVTSTEDTMIQVDWNYRTKVGTYSQGETATRKWVYFQDGAVITGIPKDNNNTVLGRYSSNGNVAASLTPLGKGWVALVGPHPEATPDWSTASAVRAYRLKNPDGVTFDIGYDFVNAAMDAGPVPTGTSSTTGAPKPTSSQESGWSSLGRGRGRMTLQNPIGFVVQGLRNML